MRFALITRKKDIRIKRYIPSSPHLLSGRRWAGKNIGLLGGSFNPPHNGHMHIAIAALRRYRLDSIWWMVSPQNPLKTKSTSFAKRFAMTQKFANHPRMVASDIETHMNTRYSLETVEKLQRHFPRTRFFWIAGMDNAFIFHRWDRWQFLLKKIPFLFFNRPPNRMAINANAIRMSRGIPAFYDRHSKDILTKRNGVAWSLTGKTRNISSTALRHKKFSSFLRNKL